VRNLACLLLLGAAMTGLYHLLPRMRPAGWSRAVLSVLGGFILAQGGLSAAIAGLGLVPKGPFQDLLHQATDYEGERPVVILVGSTSAKRGSIRTRSPKRSAAPDAPPRCSASRSAERRISSGCTT
jgi:hypothetical protein